MKVIYLPKARADLLWFRRYYNSIFPAGRRNATRHYMAAIRTILANPSAGMQVEGTPARRLGIARTPFSIIYQSAADEILVLRIFDHRGEPLPQGEGGLS